MVILSGIDDLNKKKALSERYLTVKAPFFVPFGNLPLWYITRNMK